MKSVAQPITVKLKKTPAVVNAKASVLPPNRLPAFNRGIIEESLTRRGMSRKLGVKILKISQKIVQATMQVAPEHLNRSGRVCGGILMTIGDLIGALGTLANLPEEFRTTTLESKTNFFGAGQGPQLVATSVPLHIGRTTMVWQTTIANLDQSLVAIITQTQIVIPQKKQ